MARAILYLSVIAALLPGGAAAQVVRQQNPFANARPTPPPPTSPASMKIRVEQEQVTAQIVSTPLPQVLDELAARTGLVFELAAQEATPVTVTFSRISIKEAVERLADDFNSIFYYSRDESGQSRIMFVRIFPRGNKPQQASLRYIGSGTITRTGDDTVDTPEQAVKVLEESEDVDVRQKAIEVLAAVKGDAFVEAITKALDDAAPEVRVAAIEALAGTGVHAALPKILLALKDPHPGVRQSAAVAVALMGDVENIRQLQPLTRDKDASVAAAAEMGVKKLALRRP